MIRTWTRHPAKFVLAAVITVAGAMRHGCKKYGCIIFIFILSGCCGLIRQIEFDEQNQTLFLKANSQSDITSKIRTDGFYLFADADTCKLPPYYIRVFTFYPDGYFAPLIISKEKYLQYLKWLEVDSTRIRTQYFTADDILIHDWFGGIYSVSNDTIIVENFHEDCMYRLMTIEKYKIINKTKLQWVSSTHIGKHEIECIDLSDRNSIYEFVPAPLPHPFEIKFKSKKWMWADKKDLKEYRRKVKAYEDSVKQLRK